jgi:hypothetical protein
VWYSMPLALSWFACRLDLREARRRGQRASALASEGQGTTKSPFATPRPVPFEPGVWDRELDGNP